MNQEYAMLLSRCGPAAIYLASPEGQKGLYSEDAGEERLETLIWAWADGAYPKKEAGVCVNSEVFAMDASLKTDA